MRNNLKNIDNIYNVKFRGIPIVKSNGKFTDHYIRSAVWTVRMYNFSFNPIHQTLVMKEMIAWSLSYNLLVSKLFKANTTAALFDRINNCTIKDLFEIKV